MEAIDDYANEHLARSLAYTVLELRQQHHFLALIPMASQALKQRIRYLQPATQSDAEEWNKIIQWQTDDCPEQIEHLWQHGPIKPATTVEEQHQQHSTLHDDVYQNPVYYKRFDTDTLHVVIPFNQKDDQIYLVILVLEQEQQEQDDNGASMDSNTTEEPELKYQNTKQVSLQEWQDIQSTWSSSLEDAERLFLVKVTKNAKHSRKESKSKQVDQTNKDAPDDYWGDWSSDDEERNGDSGDGKGTRKEQENGGADACDDDNDDEQLDSEDDYYARWSENPGTLTPGIDEDGNPIEDDDSISLSPDNHRRLSSTLTKQQQQQQRYNRDHKFDIQQEWDEEYDQSYNPLFTVPSVPNLVDAHTSALQELTQMLQTSLPTPPATSQHPNPSATYKRPSFLMSSMDTLPKAVQQRFEWDQELDEQDPDQDTSQHVPGAYPLSRGTKTPIDYQQQSAASKPVTTSSTEPTATTTTETTPLVVENTTASWDDQKRHAGKLLLEKSMRALVGAAKLLGLNGDDIGGMVRDILQETEKDGN
ncbi:hypothetical protein BCR42DRAFT_451068 [Absidia repens]|uniref:Uncharacterized protein n=1 Tax=Absidia repens TaxID=90262 RepID=A0A1X2IIS0_9FUNG|nr:hypothetical protein BCR42DRAFT_451068 [Absidia repens]